MNPEKLCKTCHGLGQTKHTETVTVRRAEALQVRFRDGKTRSISLRTIKQGSGCPVCHGTGIALPVEEQVAQLMREQAAAVINERPAWEQPKPWRTDRYAPDKKPQTRRQQRTAA